MCKLPSYYQLLAALAVAMIQVQAHSQEQYTKVCTIFFDKDAKQPARVEDQALACLVRSQQALAGQHGAVLYFVATADRVKDNEAGHGKERVEQDMSGEDLRYADVAAYRAVNTKAYMVRWMHVDPKQIVPLTSYEDGQWLEIDIASRNTAFKSAYPRPTAPILARPCTVQPCASPGEEFLIPQQRSKIQQH